MASIITFRYARHCLFYYCGGFAITTNYLVATELPPRTAAELKKKVVKQPWWGGKTVVATNTAATGQQQVHDYIRDNPVGWGVALSVITLTGGVLAAAGSATAFYIHGPEGVQRIQNIVDGVMKSLSE
jgi:hypothetical protein